MPSKYGFGDERKKNAPTYMKSSPAKQEIPLDAEGNPKVIKGSTKTKWGFKKEFKQLKPTEEVTKEGATEAISSFKLKSGNSPLFKQMGSSPAKQDYTDEQLKTLQHGKGTDWEHIHRERPGHQNSAEAHGETPAPPVKQAEAGLTNPETLGQIEDISGMLGSFGGGGDEEKKSVTPISVAMIPTPDVKGAR